MKKLGCISTIFVIVALISFLLNFLFLSRAIHPDIPLTKIEKKFSEKLVFPGLNGLNEKIALIRLQGIISFEETGSSVSMVSDIKDAFYQAETDSLIKAIVLFIDSPGGEVTAGDTIYNALKQLKTKKPVVVFINSIGTSAAYYIACAGSWIICTETGLTGSIGVIISSINYKQLFDKLGLQTVVFKSGALKDALSGGRDMSDFEKNYFQNLVMSMYQRFISIVASSRKLDINLLPTTVADGRILTGIEALNNRLVDQTGYVEDAFIKARTLAHAPNAPVVLYEKKAGFSQLFDFFSHLPHHIGFELKIPVIHSQSFIKKGYIYLLPPSLIES